MESILLWWMFCGAIGTALGALKGKWPIGLLLGALLGPLGVIIALFLKNDTNEDSNTNNEYESYTPILTGAIAASKIQSAFDLFSKGVYTDFEYKKEKSRVFYEIEFSPIEPNKSQFLSPFIMLLEAGVINNSEMDKIKKLHSIQHTNA